jgi:hypothetical protein
MAKMKNTALYLVSSLVVTGCASAVISDLEDDKVIVQGTYADAAMVKAEADAGCSIHGKQAVPISQRCLDGYCTTRSYLFACKYSGPSSVERTASDSSGGYGPGPWFGLRVEDSTYMGAPAVAITRIDANGPAEKAGLRVGDIVVKFDAAPVTSASGLATMKRGVALGDRVPLDIQRNGNVQRITITASARSAAL